jgi:hypothetical protein
MEAFLTVLEWFRLSSALFEIFALFSGKVILRLYTIRFMGMTVKIRKWGNSLGVILPKEMVKTQKLKAGQEVSISVFKKIDPKEIFGIVPGFKNVDTKKIMRESKQGWHD